MELDDVAPIDWDQAPLQKPGQHHLLAKGRVYGPESQKDIRMLFSKEMLGKLLDIAQQSRLGTVQLNMVGLEIDRYSAPSGHIYEVWRVRAGEAIPEKSKVIDNLFGGGG